MRRERERVMGKVFKDKQGNVIAKLLQFVATDAQVNRAITDYLDKNGITLAEGVDLKKMSSDLSKTALEVDGIKDSVSDLQKAQTNVLLQYKDHFIDTFELIQMSVDISAVLDSQKSRHRTPF